MKTLLVFALALTCSAGFAQRSSLNVRTMGVRGDGVTDDTRALQQAIDLAGRSGKDVYIPAGTYIVSATYPKICLQVQYDNMKVYGDGDRTVLKNRDNNPNAGILLVQAADPDHRQIKGVTITNFKIDGNKQRQQGSYEQKLLRINVSNTVNEPANIVVSNMTCNNAFSGILPVEGGGISIEGWDKSFRNDAKFVQNIEVYNCTTDNNGGWGIGTNWTRGYSIHDNSASRNATMGITSWNSADGLITNNVSANNHTHDINLEVSENITIDRNRVNSSADGGGIKIHNSQHVIVSNNTITHQNEWWLSFGIAVTSGAGVGDNGRFKRRPSMDVTISGNTVADAGKGTAIRIYHDVDANYPDNANIMIRNNTIQNRVSGKAVEAAGSNIRFQNNRVEGISSLNGQQVTTQNPPLIQNKLGGLLASVFAKL